MNTAQQQLKSLLKSKGTGQTMSKPLSAEQCQELLTLSTHPDINPITFATLFTALIMLERSPAEETLLAQLQKHPIAKQILKPASSHPLAELQQKLIHFENLSELEIQHFCDQLFSQNFDSILSASVFEALRIKRESFAENRLFLEACRQQSLQQSVDVPLLIDLCDPFDGLNKAFPIGLIVAALLASFEIPVLVQGAEAVGPKLGLTYPMLLKRVHKNAFISIDQAQTQINQPEIGWAYMDQRISAPQLHRFVLFRIAMLKRSVFSTVEKCIKPLKSSQQHLHITSFTHPPYKITLQELLKADEDPSLILRGIQGASQLPLDRRAPAIYFDTSESLPGFFKPEDFEITLQTPYENLDINLDQWQQLHAATLAGEKTAMFWPVIYNCQVILKAFAGQLPEISQKALIQNLESGKALAHFKKGNELV